MDKYERLKRASVPLIAFSLGLLVNGPWPDWAIVVVPTVWVLWLIEFDEARYQKNVRKEAGRRRRRQRDKI